MKKCLIFVATGIALVSVIAFAVETHAHQRDFLLLGEFNKPGAYRWKERTDVVRALELGEGVTARAQLSKVSVFRPRPDGSYQKLRIDLSSLLDQADMTRNLPLLPGDVLFVPSLPPADPDGTHNTIVPQQPGYKSILTTNDLFRLITPSPPEEQRTTPETERRTKGWLVRSHARDQQP